MNILIFGDSIAWGASDIESGGWVERLKVHFFQNEEDIDVYNLGVSGEKSGDVLKRFESEAIVRDPDMIIFAVGINDSCLSEKGTRIVEAAVFRENIVALMKQSRKFTKNVIFVGLIRVSESQTCPIQWKPEKYYTNKSIEQYDDLLQSLCREERLSYVNMRDTVGHQDLDDGLHPNASGHKKMFERVLEDVLPLLKPSV